MTVTDISTILNQTFTPNYFGENETIAADLSNVGDIGTKMSEMTGDEVQNFIKSLIVGVARNYFDTRRFNDSDLGLYIDSREYGGVIQRVKAKLLQTQSTPIWTLENGQDYFDGTYYSVETDALIYDKDNSFLIPYSIPQEMYKQYFTDADGVQSFFALIESIVANTVSLNLETLALSLYQKLISNTNNTVNLRTIYNQNAGTTLTANEFLHNATALRWAAEQINRFKKMIRHYSKKYNDGTIESFTPTNDIKVSLLTEFSTALQYNMEADTFHNELVRTDNFQEIDFWQNSSDDLLPSLDVTAQVVTTDGTNETEVNNVVGVIFDRYTMGMTSRLDKITAQYIAKGDYTTYFHHIARSSFLDKRNNAVILTLN